MSSLTHFPVSPKSSAPPLMNSYPESSSLSVITQQLLIILGFHWLPPTPLSLAAVHFSICFFILFFFPGITLTLTFMCVYVCTISMHLSEDSVFYPLFSVTGRFLSVSHSLSLSIVIEWISQKPFWKKVIICLKLSLMACLHAQNSFVILLLFLIVFTQTHTHTITIGWDLCSVLFRQLFNVCERALSPGCEHFLTLWPV